MGTFHNAISGKGEISIIAEIKRRSPSHGNFPQHAVTELMAAYEKGGAAAISVVTESTLFNGNLELLREVRNATHLPILRKDFITTSEQVEETAKIGAHAILLIARLLDKKTLGFLCLEAKRAGLDPVVEIHGEADLRKISGLTDIIIGINNRNLSTFQTDVRHAQKMLNRIPPELPIIAESAFQNPDELIPYRGKINAVLIGTSLLTAPNPFEKLLSFTKFPTTYNLQATS
jgi:indole-3-glycerol phosphate synthase